MQVTTVVHVVLAAVSVGLIAVPPFPAIAFIRVVPTLFLVAVRETHPVLESVKSVKT